MCLMESGVRSARVLSSSRFFFTATIASGTGILVKRAETS